MIVAANLGPPQMPIDPSKEDAKKKVADFNANLENRLKNLHPRDYLPYAASNLRQVLENQDSWGRYPPHFILHSMEANCAFHRAGHHARIKTRTLDKIMEVYKKFDDPAALHILNQGRETDLDLFFLMLARQQFLVQGKWGKFRIAGGVLIFLQGSFRKTEPMFQKEFGLSFDDWIKFCLLVFLASNQSKNDVTIDSRYVRAENKALSNTAVTAGFRLLSRTVEELRAEYFRVRCELPSPLLEPQLPSLLVDKPLVKIYRDNYVVTHPPFLLSCSVEGIFDLCHAHFETAFGNEIGTAFESYVGQLLGEIPGEKVLIKEKELRQYIEGQVCDYLLALKDIVMLVECKATSYSSTFVSENAVKKDNSTGKIVEGFCQLSNVAKQLDNPSLLARIGEVGDRMVIGVVVTFKHIRFANSSIYESILDPQVDMVQEFTCRPQVLDCAALETLILAACGGHSISSLFQEKLGSKTIVPSEWSKFLIDAVLDRYEIGSVSTVPLLEDTLRSFLREADQGEDDIA
jgi:hypothetical protein